MKPAQTARAPRLNLVGLSAAERLAAARSHLAAETAQRSQRISEFEVWRPTPQQFENDRQAALDFPMVKIWDLSPLEDPDAQEPPGRPVPPANTVLPSITGPNLRVGTELTSSTGAWTGDPTSYTRQWRCESEDLEGETAATYVVDMADVGLHLSVRVTASNSAGSSSATSLEVGPVPAPLARS
jgi:hypothetical protein